MGPYRRITITMNHKLLRSKACRVSRVQGFELQEYQVIAKPTLIYGTQAEYLLVLPKEGEAYQ